MGGAIPAGGTGGPPPQSNPPLPFGPTFGSVRFRTIVRDNYEIDFPSGDPALNQGDPISNSVAISGDLLNDSNLSPNGNSESDTSSSQNQIATGSFVKTVYAVNGIPVAAGTPQIAPGDTVTYRLRYSLPTGDVENLKFTDFPPLPIFDVDTTARITGFDAVVNGTAPAAGRAQFGPDDTFFARSGIVPAVGLDSAANSIAFTYGTYDDPLNSPVVVDILFTVTVSTDPFADQLLLNNGARVESNNTVQESVTGDGAADVVLAEPKLNITKGIVAASNPAGTFTPATMGPVTFNAPGTLGPRFTGTITSAGLAANPINSNLGNVDQADLVTFAIIVENTGSGPNGAFDVLLRDTLPEGLAIPNLGAEGINLRVTDGAGNPIAYEVVERGGFSLLGSIRLVDPSPAQGAIGPGLVNGIAPTDGSNIVVVTFDLLTSGNQANQLITDVATLANYANTEGGPNFVPGGLTDDAQVAIAAPMVTKELVGTEFVTPVNADDEAVIGELVTYRIRVTLPEGTTPGAALVDTLDTQLAFVGIVSATSSSGITLLGGGSLVPVSITNGGRTVAWDFESISNQNTDNTVPDFIELVYTAVVLDTADADANVLVNNSARFTYTGQSNPTTVSAPNVRIIEPQVQIDKSVSVDGAGSTGDAGDPFVYTIVLSNPPSAEQFTADAFDVTFRDEFQAGPAGSPLTNLAFTVTDSAGLVTAALFELVPDPISGRLVLQTRSGVDFDLLVDASRTITIQVSGLISGSVQPGDVIPNTASVQWTSIDGDPGTRSTFNTDSTERTGAGGVNDYVATDSADINILNVDLVKTVAATSENATTDSAAVVVGEIIRYRVTVSIPDFATPTSFQFLDLLPEGVQLIGGGLVAFVTGPGDALTSSTLTDPDPAPPDLYLTGNEANVDSLVPQFPIPASILSFTPVGSQTQVAFNLGFVSNPATPGVNDREYVVAEFNVLVLNSLSNQAGTVLTNQVFTVQDGVQTNETASTSNRVAEPSITDLVKELVQAPVDLNAPRLDTQTHDAGDLVHYGIRYSNAVGPNVSTAYDVRIVDNLPAAKMVFVPGSVQVYRNGIQLLTGFTNNSSGNTLDLSVDEVAPGDTITVLHDAILNTGVVSGEVVTNTANLTYTSLPGTNGTTTNPTGSPNVGTPGSAIGERIGDGTQLNDYSDSDAAQLPITVPALDKNILSTGLAATGSVQFDPTLTDLAVGETVTYRITITVPEGTSTLLLTDLLPALNDGTVEYVAAVVSAIGANISGSSLRALSIPIVAGSLLTFDFGSVVNTPDNVNDAKDQITIDVVGRVTDRPENAAGVRVTNTATLDYGTGVATADATAEIVEPSLTVDKTATPTAGDAGEVVTYTAVLQHMPGSTAPAYGVAFTDDLLGGTLRLVPGSVAVSDPAFQVISGNGAGDTSILVHGPVLLLGQTVSVTYRAVLPSSVPPGSLLTNTVVVPYHSAPAFSRDYSTSDTADVSIYSNSISGVVYRDLNNNGSYEPGLGETLVLDSTTFELAGVDHLNNPVLRTVTTTSGTYVFDQLRPGTYSVRELNQPAGLLDGIDSSGTPFGGSGTAASDARNPRDGETITGITIPTGSNPAGVGYDFGEMLPAAIGDFVWEDEDGNGRQDAGEPGLDRLTATLTGTDDTGHAVSLTTPTAGGGAYSFDNLRPGTYQVAFQAAAGYVFTVQDSPVADDTTDSDANSGGQTSTFALAQGETNLTIDAGQYRPASVGDFVWYDINRDGVQDPGEPGIPNVGIALDWAGLDGTFGTLDDVSDVAAQTTSTAGAYQFSNLRPGTYRVRVVASTLPNGITTPTFDLDGVATANQAEFALASGQNRTDADFGYAPDPAAASLGDLVWYDVNRDGSSAGEPGIANVLVSATWFGFDGIENTSDDLSFTDKTDASGIYGIGGLPFGSYRVTVDASTLPPNSVATYDLDSGITNADGKTLVTLTAAAPIESRADFGYTGQAAFGDRVWLDFNGDGIQDAIEPGMPGVTITTTWAGPDGDFGFTADNVTLATTTGANGIYGFSNLPAGLWRATVTGGLPAAVANTGDPDGVLDSTADFRLASTTSRSDIDFGFQGNNSLAGYAYRDFNVNGLREPAGANPETGIGGVAITLTGTDTRGNTFTVVTQTASDGSYFFDGLPDGDCLITETQPPSVFTAGPAGFYDGLDSVGTAGGDSPAKNQLHVRFDADIDGKEYNFGENPPGDPFGYVYQDLNQNGVREPGEPGIAGVTITLSGVAFPGTPLQFTVTAADLPGGSLRVQTNAAGLWVFPLAPPGTYSFVETQPGNFIDGAEENADPNGPFTVIIGPDRFDNVVLNPFPTRGPFNFGEIVRVDPVPPVPPFPPPPVPTPSKWDLLAGLVPLPTPPNLPLTPNFAEFGAPALRPITFAAVAQDVGGGLVRVFDFANGNERFRFQPYADFTGGVRVAIADVTRDGVPDIITVPGPGGGPVVRVFDGNSGAMVLNVMAFDSAFRGGLFVATADFSGDFVPDIVVTPDSGGGPVVQIYDGAAGALLANFLALDETFRGGLRPATGDVNADGTPDLLLTAGTGGGPRVAGYDGTTLLGGAPSRLFGDFFGFAPELRSGFWITAADVNGDGFADVFLGAGEGGAPRVAIYDGQTLATGGGAVAIGSFFAGDPNARNGVRIAAVDLESDGQPELMAATGPVSFPIVSIFDPATGALRDQFQAFPPGYVGGVFVG